MLTNMKSECNRRVGGSPMRNNVIFLHGQPSKIGHYIRVGGNHRQAETLLGAGRLSAESVVIDAGVAQKQLELVSSLREAGRELILDTNVAELSSTGKFDG